MEKTAIEDGKDTITLQQQTMDEFTDMNDDFPIRGNGKRV